MTTKEYLQQLRHLRGLIRAKEEKIVQLRERATSCSNRISCDPRAQGVSDKLSESIAAICDLEAKIIADKIRLTRKEAKIIAQIDAVNDIRLRRILTLRYVNNKNWYQIVDDMDYEYRWLLQLHGEALSKFEQILKNKALKCT